MNADPLNILISNLEVKSFTDTHTKVSGGSHWHNLVWGNIPTGGLKLVRKWTGSLSYYVPISGVSDIGRMSGQFQRRHSSNGHAHKSKYAYVQCQKCANMQLCIYANRVGAPKPIKSSLVWVTFAGVWTISALARPRFIISVLSQRTHGCIAHTKQFSEAHAHLYILILL